MELAEHGVSATVKRTSPIASQFRQHGRERQRFSPWTGLWRTITLFWRSMNVSQPLESNATCSSSCAIRICRVSRVFTEVSQSLNSPPNENENVVGECSAQPSATETGVPFWSKRQNSAAPSAIDLIFWAHLVPASQHFRLHKQMAGSRDPAQRAIIHTIGTVNGDVVSIQRLKIASPPVPKRALCTSIRSRNQSGPLPRLSR
jgi:hypothetical protein